MKKSSAFILILLAPSLLLAQAFVDTMYYDRDWKQCSKVNSYYFRIISPDTSEQFLMLVQDFYPSGQIQMQGTYRSIEPDYKEGLFTYWYEDGTKQIERNFKNNSPNGVNREWYPSGSIKTEHYYSEGVLNGRYRIWRDNSGIKLETRYLDGEKHGDFISYYENGNKIRQDLYDRGRLIEGKCFSPEGEPVENFPYILTPAFKGGEPALEKYIRKELRYPPRSARKGTDGWVIVMFTVDENGVVKEPRVLEGSEDSFNKEALRLVSGFPEWIPGKIDNLPSPMQVSLPLRFSGK